MLQFSNLNVVLELHPLPEMLKVLVRDSIIYQKWGLNLEDHNYLETGDIYNIIFKPWKFLYLLTYSK